MGSVELMKKAILLWQAITPLHPGTGQESASTVDLPVAREGGTLYPMIPASTIKGVFRDGVGLRDGDDESSDAGVKAARSRFGYADRTTKAGKTQSGVGELTFTDARLLGLPVPSFKGTFAVVTAPLVLQRLSRDRELLGFPALTIPKEPQQGDLPEAVVGTKPKLDHGGRIYLNDLDFTTRPDESIDTLCAEIHGW